jgi:hypothetical protein
MSSVPALPSLSKSLSPARRSFSPSFLKIGASFSKAGYPSIEKQTRDAVANKRYLYIDFQTESTLGIR